MASCKDCLHYEVCQAFEDNGQVGKIPPRYCDYFVDRSKVIDLPCKVGDTVYVICKDDRIRAKSIRLVSILESNVIYYFDDGKFNSNLNEYCCENNFGKTVFLTFKKAEQALKERETNG